MMNYIMNELYMTGIHDELYNEWIIYDRRIMPHSVLPCFINIIYIIVTYTVISSTTFAYRCTCTEGMIRIISFISNEKVLLWSDQWQDQINRSINTNAVSTTRRKRHLVCSHMTQFPFHMSSDQILF